MGIDLVLCPLHRSNCVFGSFSLKDFRQPFKNDLSRVDIDICKELAESNYALDVLVIMVRIRKGLRSLRQRTIPGLHHTGDLGQPILLIHFPAIFAIIEEEQF